MDTQTGKSNNHYVVSSTIQVIEDRTIVWVYQDSAKDRLLEGRDDKSTRLHIKCNLMTDNNSRIIRHVSVMGYHSQCKNISSNGRNKIYNILKWLLILVVKLVVKVVLQWVLIQQQLH